MPFDSMPQIVTSPAVKIVEQMRDLMAKRGLAKFSQEDDKGRVCVYGAMSIVLFGHAAVYITTNPERTQAWDAIDRSMTRVAEKWGRQARYERGRAATGINNAPGTTLNDMLRFLDEVKEDLAYAV